MEQNKADTAVEQLKNSIDNNAKDSPRLSISEDKETVAIVGDTSKIKPVTKPYKLRFTYPEGSLDEEALAKYQKDEETGEYFAIVEYENRRVKPLHRTKVAMLVTRILTSLGAVTKAGYSTDTITRQSLQVFVENTDSISEIIRLVCDVPDDQIVYLDPSCLLSFWTTLLDNEPNIIKEGTNFLL